ncbi:ATP-binding protein [Sphingomonas morindae]|uniref:histidine kinase n=1 Tax=Sphingomonas morindae TaxID=1541170 RepID=A0ABY4X8P6_9SPHN|nr:ATP-binding protein [Sphingomonas morindae]USI73249.1 HAMP domain-containing protein [Sphingomonas morindae]
MRRPLVRSVGLLGRLFAILFCTVVVQFAVSTLLYEQSSRYLVREDEARRLAEHLVIATKLISEQKPPERPRMAERLTTGRYRIGWAPAPPPRPPGAELEDLRDQVIGWEPSLAGREMRLGLAPGHHGGIGGVLRLEDGSWLRFAAAGPVALWEVVGRRILIALFPAAILALIGAALFRRTLRPIGTLARAADRVGHGGLVRVPESGPGEVRRLIRAFNTMQERIRRLIKDRTEALAAVGHDLRTPLARLRLRSDTIPDPAARRAILEDVEEMGEMLSSLLAYLGGDSDPEKPVRTDVAVLAATLVDSVQDRGLEGRYEGPDHCEWLVRPLGLKRALGNLVENALHYGGAANVTLIPRDDGLEIAVEDEGPGIPEDRIAAALQPFARLDPARGRNTSGLGLGLAIVQRAMEREGGALRLANRAEGGLRAALWLPRPAA